MPEIRGRIIRILDKRTVIINLGAEDGILGANIFRIFGKPEQIVDPDTKEDLGSIILVKARLKASQVFDRFTIATSRWSEMSFGTSSFGITSGIGALYTSKEVDEGELNVLSEEIEPWKATSEELLRVGDIVETEVTDLQEESLEEDEEEISSSADTEASGEN